LPRKGLTSGSRQPRGVGTPELLRANIGRSIATGTCYLVIDDPKIVGTITADRFADPEFSIEADHPDDALYVHSMVVRRDRAGQGIRNAMIGFADELASKAGKKWLRLDAWKANEALHSYYRSAGFEHVRTTSCAHRGSGALFQREVMSNLGTCLADRCQDSHDNST
jgi:GNAT superfamily N-acetyltransferase